MCRMQLLLCSLCSYPRGGCAGGGGGGGGGCRVTWG